MKARHILLILFAIWLACQVLAWVHPYFTPPTGDDFAREINMIGLFMIWQSLAVLVAVALLAVRLMRADELTRGLKWLGHGPILLQGLAIMGLTIYATTTS